MAFPAGGRLAAAERRDLAVTHRDIAVFDNAFLGDEGAADHQIKITHAGLPSMLVRA